MYAVWRHFQGVNIFGLAGTPNCKLFNGGSVTPAISCSEDSGATWKHHKALTGIDDFPRVAVGRDGKVYVVGMSGDSVVLSRFSSCRDGLKLESGFPRTVWYLTDQVHCPVPGLDRCNDGNSLSSATVAPDSEDARHLSVSYAENIGHGERIVTLVSHDAGRGFDAIFTQSPPDVARRFMPWSCMTGGHTFVGWYGRAPADSLHNDLTDYVVGGTLLGEPINLSNNPDPQCRLWVTLHPAARTIPSRVARSRNSPACAATTGVSSVIRIVGATSAIRIVPPAEAARRAAAVPSTAITTVWLVAAMW